MLIYEAEIKSSIKRFLSLGDSNYLSPTFGCFDRNYWHYRTVTDFPSAPFQMAALSLALLYKLPFEENFCYQNLETLHLAQGATLFWSKIQRADGSFDEWYPFEHSFVATAFTSFGISEALLLLKDEVEESVLSKTIKALEKSACWLSKHEDLVVSNHQAGAIPALYNIFLLTGKDIYQKWAEEKIKKLLSVQTEEGWFPEYQGADPGYSSLTLDFLVKYYQKSRDEKAKKAIEKLLNFMVYFLHPDGSYGGEYGSRNTKYLFPHGLEILSSELPQAAYLLQPFYRPEKHSNLVNLLSVDDRFLVFFFLPNYLQALKEFKQRGKEPEYLFNPWERKSEKMFPQAGLIVKKTPFYITILNFKKSGVMKVFSLEKLVFSESGYFGATESGKVVTTHHLVPEKEVKIEETENGKEISLKTFFVYANYSLPLKKYLLPFRTFNYLLGWSGRIMNFFSHKLKEKMILGKKKSPLEMERKIILGDEEVIIEDRIINKGLKILKLELLPSATALHVPSSRFYLPSQSFSISLPPEVLEKVNQRKEVKVKIIIKSKKGEVRFSFL